MPQTPRTRADLRQLFLGVDAAGDFASVSQGTKADQAYAFSQRAAGFATAAQGSNADTAFGWGDHALAGYLTLATLPLWRKTAASATPASLVLSPAPLAGSAIQVFVDTGAGYLLREEGAGVLQYTVAGDTITFGGSLVGANAYMVFHQG